MTSYALKADLVVRLPVRPVVRRDRRRSDRLPQDRAERTPLLWLVGTAMLGWMGLMLVVTVLAI